MHSHSWSLVVTPGQLVVTRGHSWSLVVTRGHSWSPVVTRGHSWSLVCTFRHDRDSRETKLTLSLGMVLMKILERLGITFTANGKCQPAACRLPF